MPSAKKKGVKILVKCSWSGARIPTPETFTLSATLSQIISSISSNLPPVITRPLQDGNEPQPSIVYMRTNILKRDWEITRISDFCDEGSILLTLNLPKEDGLSNEVKPAASSEGTEPMDIDVDLAPATTAAVKATTPKQAMERLIQSNFDQDSVECLTTILKMIDNIVSKSDAKFRSIRITNKSVEKKIVSKKGGLDVLFALGFEYDIPAGPIGFDFDNSLARTREAGGTGSSKAENIILKPENENQNVLIAARRDLIHVLTSELKVAPNGVPSMPRVRPSPSMSTNVNSTVTKSFDPFKSQSFNTQAAAAGAPNPNAIKPDGSSAGKSTTEKKLEMLQKKQQKLEKSLQALDDRCITAFLPGEIGPIVSVRSPGGSNIGERTSDSALIASQMMKRMEERKKKEEGGFTTKSMRDLEKMKNAKVYSHAQLKICFPDGSWIEAKFLPNENIGVVKNVVLSTFCPEHATSFQFDLYIAPPRRILADRRSLKEEGLVPAAKIHVSWKKGAGPLPNTPPGSYLQRQFYQNAAISSGSGEFPSSVAVLDSANNKEKSSKGKEKSDGKATKEDELMQRMLGKRKGLLGSGVGKNVGSGNDGGKKLPGKPKWFKG